MLSGLVISPTVKLIDLTLTDLTYTWETKAKDSGSWELISTSEVLLLYQKLVGNVIRLSSKAMGKSLFLSLLLNISYKSPCSYRWPMHMWSMCLFPVPCCNHIFLYRSRNSFFECYWSSN